MLKLYRFGSDLCSYPRKGNIFSNLSKLTAQFDGASVQFALIWRVYGVLTLQCACFDLLRDFR